MTHPTVSYHRPPTPPDRRTVIVFGHFRGGTSMVAGVLRLFDLFLGDEIEHGNNEDVEFKHAPPDVLREKVHARDALHDVWGFKFPGVFLNGEEWIDDLRNPYFVCITRDLLASAQREVYNRRFEDEFEALRAKCAHQQRMLEYLECIMGRRLPLLLVSYERALRHQEAFVDSLAEFVGLDASDDARQRAVDYITPERGHGDPYVSLNFVRARRLREELKVRGEVAGAAPSRP